jgi:NAD dependent epimerase/dehydratase family enzyme
MGDEMLLASQRALPARLKELGFRFAFPNLESALRYELGRS